MSESTTARTIRLIKAEAWAEGVVWAGYTYDDAETANPYRTTTKETKA